MKERIRVLFLMGLLVGLLLVASCAPSIGASSSGTSHTAPASGSAMRTANPLPPETVDCTWKPPAINKEYYGKYTVCEDHCSFKLNCINNWSSMYPLFDCNDKLTFEVRPRKEDIKVCDVIWFLSDERKDINVRAIVHQVIGITPNGYITKGTNNKVKDNEVASFANILGRLIKVERRV